MASDGIRQSPRGLRVTEPILGPSGIQERLNCWLKKRRCGFQPLQDGVPAILPWNTYSARRSTFFRRKGASDSVVEEEIVELVRGLPDPR